MPEVDASFLKGKHVAFTGKLASMTRAEAAALVRKHGGRFDTSLSRRTAYLVIGQEGWPLQDDGRPTAKLLKAQRFQRLGHQIELVPEEALLDRLGLGSRTDEIRRLYTTGELIRLLRLPRERLRAWIRAGLISPVESQQGVDYFDFRQVTSARTLCNLIAAGVSVNQVRKGLGQIEAWLGTLEQPLAQLAILERSGELLVRFGDNLVEPGGQLRFDFDGSPEEPVVELSATGKSAEELFELGCEHEEAGRCREAEASYRQSLQLGGPDSVCCFNLANVLYAQGRKAEAAERYYQAVELDNGDAAAWNNLGAVLSELRLIDEAIQAYERAITLDHQDAHFNLAELYEKKSDISKAREHWRAYLSFDSTSAWASHARRKLKTGS